MCGRYRIEDGADSPELRELIGALNRRHTGEGVKTSGEVFPSDTVPVVAMNRSMKPGVFPMEWGFTLPDGRRIINARSETARERPLFSEGMARRRCAVPAACYYEWTHDGRRDKYAICAPEGGATYMAGLYRIQAGRPSFVILTRAPADEIAFIHSRMPVLLPRSRIGAWIDPGADAPALLGEALQTVRFSRVAPEIEQTRMTF